MTTIQPIAVSRDARGNILAIDMVMPSNFHAHARDGAMMEAVCYDLMRWVMYILFMPNTGPIDTIEKVVAYRAKLLRIRDALGLLNVEIIMTVYLTDKLTAHMVHALADLPFRVEVKGYPPHKGATTGSGLGIPLEEVSMDTWNAMTEHKIPFLGHFERVEDFDGRMLPMTQREDAFMAHDFPRLRDRVPDLKICIEHASTRAAIARVKEDPSGNTVCGFTPHHLLISIDDLRQKSWANHGRCMPIPKGPEDVAACLEFATSGDRRVILGDDSAPHPSKNKEGPFEDAACGCWLPHALALYAYAFASVDALDDRFVQFACYNGADWRGLPRPSLDERVRLVADNKNDIPDPLPVPAIDDRVIPLGWTEEPDRLKIGLALAIENELRA